MSIREEREVEYFKAKDGEEYILTKRNGVYCFVERYLLLLTQLPILMSDKEFRRRYDLLNEYVMSKVGLPDSNDIIEEYCVFVQKK